MEIHEFTAKNGEKALEINGLNIYSTYKPTEDAKKYVHSEFDENAEGYILLGVGLGYHLEALINLNGNNKPIIACCFNEVEYACFSRSEIFTKAKHFKNVTVVKNIENLEVNGNFQLIMSQVWLQVIGKKNPLYNILLEIKTKLKSYKKNSALLEKNFQLNSAFGDYRLEEMKMEIPSQKVACLVSAGPSLENTLKWLNKFRKQIYILCVGSALNSVEKAGITSDAVIITDPREITLKQVGSTYRDIPFFYLSTVYPEIIRYFKGPRTILLQQGYSDAENKANELDYPLLETGGSVATTAFSLLEYLGFKEIILFGQDLGFSGHNSHSKESTSNTVINSDKNFLKVLANNDEYINTLPNLMSFKNWFERKIAKCEMDVYNTSLAGARIMGTSLIDEDAFYKLLLHKEL